MNPNKQAISIIDQYADYHPELGVDPLMEMRQQLSIACTKIANFAKQQEGKSKNLYTERKIAEATTKLSEDGTGVVKEALAITKHKNLRIEQSKAEGAAKGAQIVLNSYYKVLDSMSSYIRIMTNI